MRGSDGPGQPVMGRDRDTAALSLAQGGVRCHHPDRRVQGHRLIGEVPQLLDLGSRRRAQLRQDIGGPGPPSGRINHQPNRIRNNNGTDDNSVAHIHAGRTDATLERSGPGASTGTHRTPIGRIVGEFCRSVTEFSVRPVLPGAHRQIEDDRSRDDGHGASGQRHSPTALLEPTHHPVGSGQPVGTAPGEHDGVDGRDRIGGVEQIRLTRARRPTAHVDSARGPRRRQHHGGAGGPACSEARIGVHPLVMTHEYSRNIGDRPREQAHTADLPINASTSSSCITVSQW
ncbi:Uncharacterised protein [Mycobacteroides abscessus subsp. abscessus]|nr:Uncharacterised protein [Mycobacteroides abscessus subsp. abscessus]